MIRGLAAGANPGQPFGRFGPMFDLPKCPALDDDTPETLAHRVFEEEKIAYPKAIELFAQGRLRIEGRRVRVLPPETK